MRVDRLRAVLPCNGAGAPCPGMVNEVLRPRHPGSEVCLIFAPHGGMSHGQLAQTR